MANWVKKRIKLQTLMGVVKDQFSSGRAIAKHGQLTQIDLAVLRSTNHEEQAMQEEAVRSILEVGTGSRMRVSYCIRVIMERLNRTSSWVVALKCLILIHRCLQEGGFMFRDQLSVHPAQGGHNYLNLARFKDTSSPFAWSVSVWIRWYARFIEQCIEMARNTRSSLDMAEDRNFAHIQKLLAVPSWQLVREISTLYDLLQEASSWQAEESVATHVLVKEGIRLVVVTTFSAYEGIKLRLHEAQKRAAALEPSEALMVMHICEKLSMDAMSFTHLLEFIKDRLLHHECIALERVLLSDYDLMRLKQSFRLARSNSISPSPQQLEVNDGMYALPWRSGSLNGSNSGLREVAKPKPRASLTLQRLPM